MGGASLPAIAIWTAAIHRRFPSNAARQSLFPKLVTSGHRSKTDAVCHKVKR